MQNRTVILGTAVFVVCFLVFGLLGIMENPVIMGLMIAGYLAILVKIIIGGSKSGESK